MFVEQSAECCGEVRLLLALKGQCLGFFTLLKWLQEITIATEEDVTKFLLPVIGRGGMWL